MICSELKKKKYQMSIEIEKDTLTYCKSYLYCLDIPW